MGLRWSRGAAALGVLLVPAGAGADPVPLCNVGYSVPRITPAALASAGDVAIVEVTEVDSSGDLLCRVKARVRTVEKGELYSAGQAIEFRLRCAGEGSSLRHPNSPWLYSDLPAAGIPGRLYQDHRFAPPGPHFLNLRPEPEGGAVASAAESSSRSLC
jgi:hypothetical protein